MNMSIRKKRSDLSLPRIIASIPPMLRQSVVGLPRSSQVKALPKIISCRSNYLMNEVKKTSELEAKYLKSKLLKDQTVQKREKISEKIRVLSLCQRKHGIKFSKQEIDKHSNDELIVMAAKLHEKRQKRSAALVISNWWKRIIIHEKLKTQSLIIKAAAKKLQNAWKAYAYRKNLLASLKRFLNRCHQAAILIQQSIKSFISRKNHKLEAKKQEMQSIFANFASIRQSILKSLWEKVDKIISTKLLKSVLSKYQRNSMKETPNLFLEIKKQYRSLQYKCQPIKIVKQSTMHSEPPSPTQNPRVHHCH